MHLRALLGPLGQAKLESESESAQKDSRLRRIPARYHGTARLLCLYSTTNVVYTIVEWGGRRGLEKGGEGDREKRRGKKGSVPIHAAPHLEASLSVCSAMLYF